MCAVIGVQRQPQLFEVVGATGAPRRRAGLLNRWEQHRHQQTNDGDHDEQFNERESTARVGRVFHDTVPVWGGDKIVAHDTTR